MKRLAALVVLILWLLATGAALAEPAIHHPGDVVAWKEGLRVSVGVVMAAEMRHEEWWYVITTAKGRTVRMPESKLIAKGGQVCTP